MRNLVIDWSTARARMNPLVANVDHRELVSGSHGVDQTHRRTIWLVFRWSAVPAVAIFGHDETGIARWRSPRGESRPPLSPHGSQHGRGGCPLFALGRDRSDLAAVAAPRRAHVRARCSS